MTLIETKPEMRRFALGKRAEAKRIGLVPTMGALHDGHFSLVRKAREECDTVVVSIFVNPTQFGPGEDFERYPRTFDSDRAACETLGVDALFAPSGGEMYAPGAETFVVQERLAAGLCGAARPHHFRGVLTVVLKLFNIVLPHAAYFGQKDYQQCAVLRRMVLDLDVPVEVRVLPTVREPDGLALSSRNRYLGPEERDQAAVLFRSLDLCEGLFREGERSTQRLKYRMHALIRKEPLARIDYIKIVSQDTLQPAGRVAAGDVVMLAVWFGETRLIDNRILGA